MKLTVITPIHNEKECINLFYERIKPVLDSLEGLSSWNIVFVNDGSTDNSLDLLKNLRQRDKWVKIVNLSRNFGYQAALTAGLKSVESDLYAFIDVDCEDPPELLKNFYAHMKEGYHLSYGIRSQRLEPKALVLCRKLFYQLNKFLADSEVYMWMAEFSMFTRPVRDAILTPHTTFPFLRTEMAYSGFKAIGVKYQRERRVAGTSHYNIYRMAKFAVAGILASTTFPLRAIVYCSVIMGLIFILTIGLIPDLSRLADITALYGFIYLIFTMPLIGMYLARTYKNIVNRPNYFVDPNQTFLD